MSLFLAHLKAFVQLAAVQAPTEDLLRAHEAKLGTLLQQASDLTLQICFETREVLQKSSLPESWTQLLLGLAEARLKNMAKAGSSFQSWKFFPVYLGQDMQKELLEASNLWVKFERLLRFLISKGLRKPSKETYGVMLVCVHLHDLSLLLDPVYAYDLLQEFKERARQVLEHQAPMCGELLWELPFSPAVLPVPNVFFDQEPEAFGEVQHWLTRIPLRANNALLLKARRSRSHSRPRTYSGQLYCEAVQETVRSARCLLLLQLLLLAPRWHLSLVLWAASRSRRA